jgi:phosphate transport system substrate-binding protein
MSKKIVSLLLVAALSVFMIAGCTTTDESTDESTATISGEINGGGSTSVKSIIEAAGDEFSAQNTDVTFTYAATGSSDGVTGASEGTYSFGCASRNLKDEEEELGLTTEVFAYDGIAVIVNPENTAVTDISMEDIAAVYKGEITNWSELGGDDAEIVVVSREDGSGTRGAFEEIVGFEDELTEDATIAEGNGNVQTTVAGNPNAIGYVSFTYVDDTVTALTVDGVEATTDNVLAETYSVSRPFLIFYLDADDATMAFIDFILSDEGQAIVEEEGAIPVS